MKWESPLISEQDWSSKITNRKAKEEVARQLALEVKDNDVIGFGSGSTSFLAIKAIGARIRHERISCKAIPTSAEVALACIAAGIPITSLWENRPNWSFDGADEVDPVNNLLKGRGGAMFREKLVMRCSPKIYILVDHSKLVSKLGTKFPIPIEVYPEAMLPVERKLRQLGAYQISLRLAVKKDGPVITESGNFILDIKVQDIRDSLEKEIKEITGVIESGLFIGYDIELLSSVIKTSN